MPDTLAGQDWDALLESLEQKHCVPFLGAGAAFGALPLGGALAQEWADAYHYPMDDKTNLPKVAQFLAVTQNPVFPKQRVVEKLKAIGPPDNANGDEPHAVLASLPIPLFMTTNYDTFLSDALQSADKDPARVLSQWNPYLKTTVKAFPAKYDWHPANPIVFHLHGGIENARSLVLTENDYLEFMVNMTRTETLLPTPVRDFMAESSLLFIGYSLADVNFRVLYRQMQSLLSDISAGVNFTVQPLPVPNTATDAERKAASDYLTAYFKDLNIRVYWGTAREFAADLRDKWPQYKRGVRFSGQ